MVSSRVVWTLLVTAALASQVFALIVFGHTIYLWVQGIEALLASVALFAFGIRYRRHDPRANRWPPLLPLAAIAATGGIKDLYVALGPETPLWLIVMLLASVAWLLGSSWTMWRTEQRSRTL